MIRHLEDEFSKAEMKLSNFPDLMLKEPDRVFPTVRSKLVVEVIKGRKEVVGEESGSRTSARTYSTRSTNSTRSSSRCSSVVACSSCTRSGSSSCSSSSSVA